MSGTKTSRADLKNRYKKGMYPTEEDFANVFESYVHKDDDISMSKVVLTDGDGNTTTLNNVIGNKADKTDLTEITNRLTTAENDIDTAEDNIAGHETRIQGLEAFKERVRAFLEDADASEETINRWHEIESFLQGITDTQTLTGLLNDLKQEILQSIPQSQQGNYLQLIDDLDAYTDAPVGTIVKYTGPTTDSYTHGFDYEKVAGQGGATIPAGSYILEISENNSNANASAWAAENQGPFVYEGICQFGEYGGRFYYPVEKPIVPGSRLYNLASISDFVTVASVDGDTITTTEPSMSSYHSFSATPVSAGATTTFYRYVSPDGTVLLSYAWAAAGEKNTLVVPWDLLDEGAYWFNTGIRITQTSDDTVIPAPASWQPCKSMSVID